MDHSQAQEIDGLKIFRFEGSLYFASCDKFREKLYLRTGLNPREVLRRTARSASTASAAAPQSINVNPTDIQLELRGVRAVSQQPASANSTAATDSNREAANGATSGFAGTTTNICIVFNFVSSSISFLSFVTLVS